MSSPASIKNSRNAVSAGCLGIRNPLSKTRQAMNILGIILGLCLFILSGALALSSLPLNPVLLAFIAILGTVSLVAGLVALHARKHLSSITHFKNTDNR